MIKIVHIVSGVGGGAGIAALRFHREMQNTSGVSSSILQKNDTSEVLQTENIYTLYESKNIFYRLKRKLGLTPEMRQSKLIATFPRYNEYEVATFPTSSYRVEDHPLVKGADIIHLHWIGNFVNYPTFFSKVRKPIVWTLHDKNPFLGLFHTETDEKNNNSSYGALDEKTQLDKAQYLSHTNNLHIVTPSEWLSKKSKESKALGRFPHNVICNGIDFSEYNADPILAKKKIKVDNGLKTFIFIAHSINIPRRGFHLMIEAMRNLEYPEMFNLISVGGEKTNIGNSNVNHIHYENTNDINLLNDLYSAADIQILPTLEDNLPNVMIESFANGTPVLSFPNGGMAEHIRTGENGILVESIDMRLLSNAIDDFLKGKYTFDREKIKQYAKETFDIKRQTQKYIELYKNILSR